MMQHTAVIWTVQEILPDRKVVGTKLDDVSLDNLLILTPHYNAHSSTIVSVASKQVLFSTLIGEIWVFFPIVQHLYVLI